METQTHTLTHEHTHMAKHTNEIKLTWDTRTLTNTDMHSSTFTPHDQTHTQDLAHIHTQQAQTQIRSHTHTNSHTPFITQHIHVHI